MTAPASARPTPQSGGRLWALAAHVSPFFGFWILIPALLWLIKRESSPFVRWHAAQSVLLSLWSIVYYFVFVVGLMIAVGAVGASNKLGITEPGGATGGVVFLGALAMLFLPTVVTVLCAIAALSGRCWRLPVVGPKS